MHTLTLITEEVKDSNQVSQILLDDVSVAWIEHDCKRAMVFKDHWYYVNGENVTIRDVLEAIGYTKYVVTWTSRGEKYDIHDEIVINAPQNTIRVFSNPENYFKYNEYDESLI